MKPITVLSLLFGLLVGCGDDAVTDEENVKIVFNNFQPTIAKIIEKGLEAKDASTSGANITPIMTTGDVMGEMTVGGQVAQSTSQNENLNLWVQLDGYADTEALVYQTDNTTDETKLQFDLQINSQPADNVMSGLLVGELDVIGAVEGTGSFDLAFMSDLDDNDASLSVICSHVTGTVTSGDATNTIDFVDPGEGLSDEQRIKCEGL